MNLEDMTKPSLARERTDEDVDLVSTVKMIMDDQKYALAEAWLSGPSIQEALGKNTELQRFLINRDLRIRLGMATVQTSIERFVLDSNTGLTEYLDNLKTRVVPALIKIASDLH